MSQYRYNLITNRWAIIASQRNKRPIDFASKTHPAIPSHDPKCPFCPGNEHMTPPESYALRADGTDADQPGWSVRVVPNKFPAVYLNHDSAPADDLLPGNGIHEVIIESPRHDQHLAHYSHDQTCRILDTLRQRSRTHAEHPAVKLISIFNNHGPSSGASLVHPHFQLIALAMVPPRLTAQLNHCRDYYNEHKIDVFQKTIEQETASGQRVIVQNEHFIALCPFASMTPFEVYFLPTRPVSHFEQSSDAMLAGLARLLGPILARLSDGLSDPDYNLAIHTAPIGDDLKYFRWYLQLYPRMHPSGGFEIGTDIFINTMPPESAAQFYLNK